MLKQEHFKKIFVNKWKLRFLIPKNQGSASARFFTGSFKLKNPYILSGYFGNIPQIFRFFFFKLLADLKN